MDARESALLTLGLYASLLAHARGPIPERQRHDGWEHYKKGWELRFRLRTEDEVEFVRALVSRAGWRPGRAYAKRRGMVLPVYGRAAVAEILAAAGRPLPAE